MYFITFYEDYFLSPGFHSLQAVDLGPAIFTHAFWSHQYWRAFGHLITWIPLSRVMTLSLWLREKRILLICGCDPATSQIQFSLTFNSTSTHSMPSSTCPLQPGIVHNVVINDIRPGVVASAGFVVQVIIEPLFVDAGGGPEFCCRRFLFFFVSSDRPQYRISIAQVEK